MISITKREQLNTEVTMQGQGKRAFGEPLNAQHQKTFSKKTAATVMKMH